MRSAYCVALALCIIIVRPASMAAQLKTTSVKGSVMCASWSDFEKQDALWASGDQKAWHSLVDEPLLGGRGEVDCENVWNNKEVYAEPVERWQKLKSGRTAIKIRREGETKTYYAYSDAVIGGEGLTNTR